MVTLKDVADAAGVSMATVSRVVRGKGKVGDSCRARVQKVIDEMGYRPNLNARALANKKADMFGLICPNVSSPFFGSVADGVSSVAKETDHRLIMCNSQGDFTQVLKAINTLQEHGCQNIILHSHATPAQKLIELTKKIPGLVILSRNIAEISEHCVWLNNQYGGQLWGNYLLKKGHKDFTIFVQQASNYESYERINGLKHTLQEAGLSWSEQCVQVFEGLHNIEKLIAELNKKGNLTKALIAANDSVAIGLINGLKALGKRVPEDVSVIGFDDLHIFSYACYPRLTTVKYPIAEMAAHAARLSLRLTEKNQKIDLSANLFTPELVERNSVL